MNTYEAIQAMAIKIRDTDSAFDQHKYASILVKLLNKTGWNIAADMSIEIMRGYV